MLSSAVHDTFLVAAWLLALAWLRRAVEALVGIPTMLDLTEIARSALPPLADQQSPHLTVVVPARDEGASIEATLRSLLAQTGIRLQIIAVDDRSTDGTGETMDKLRGEALSGPHVYEVLHVRALPEGWLGKPHALARGIDQAKAPWLLFTDGDILFAPDALHLALQVAIREKADHFMLAPTLIAESWGERAIQATIQVLGNFVARPWKIGDPNAKDAFGVGGFSLVSRAALAAIGGMERLRMEVVEDVGLGWLIKREAHRRSLMVLGPDLVRVRWLRGMFGIVKLLEKNAFAGMRFSVTMAVVVCIALLIDAFLPLAALGVGPWGVTAAVVMYAAVAIGIYANRRLNGLSSWLALAFAPAVLIMAWAFFRSMWLTLERGGVVWRGTLYPLKELKEGMASFRLR